MTIIDLPINSRVIEEIDRNLDGNYLIEPGFIHIFPFEIPGNDFIRTHIYQFDRRESFSIRAWVSKLPNDSESFFRFHPGTGGVTHMFYDESSIAAPLPVKGNTQRNQFSGISFTPQDDLIALEPGTHHFNVLNMELQENGYHLNFIVPPTIGYLIDSEGNRITDSGGNNILVQQ